VRGGNDKHVDKENSYAQSRSSHHCRAQHGERPRELRLTSAGLVCTNTDAGNGLDHLRLECAHILAVLEACQWCIKGADHAATRLGLPPSILRNACASP
jgi:hypothetical protein